MDLEKKAAVLVASHLHLAFGGLKALDDVSLEVRAGEILGLIGPNGSGKTSTVNCISGFYRPQQGDIYLGGQTITRLPPHKIAALGISRTFQNIHLYTTLPVVDNLLAARHLEIHSGWLEGGLYFGRAKKEEVAQRAAVENVIEFLGLEEHRKTVVGALPYGLRKKVDLGRALAQHPKVLLLDEPLAGMNSEEKQDMAHLIKEVRDETGIPILIIEHDMVVIMRLVDRIVTLCYGQKIAEGSPEEIAEDPRVVEAYLGEQPPAG